MAGAVVLPTVSAGAAGATTTALVAVVVDGTSSDATAVAVERAGGEVDARLALIGAVTAQVPSTSIAALEAAGYAVVADTEVRPVDNDFAADGQSAVPAVEAAPAIAVATGAGAGVGIALIDTGVADLAPLAGRVQHGKSFGEGDGDTFGHGTFMAGLIAGAAPEARIVSIKAADGEGTTSLGTLIEAIGWAVVHQDDAAMPFEVLNLSFGAVAPVPAPADPLAQAVEAAWASGLTVVVASGNEGEGTVTSPGTSPSVITVGSATLELDAVAAWSGRAKKGDKPEVLAPGTSVVSLRVPGSTIDLANPAARVGEDGFRGSGTSMATAVTSGAAALVLAQHPGARPADVKGALVDTAVAIPGGSIIDVAAALSQTPSATAPAKGSDKSADRAKGSDKGAKVATPGWEGSRWTGSRWTGSRWTGSRWTGSRWTESSWADAEWAGSRWTGSRWTGSRWTGSRWTGSRWTTSLWAMADEAS